MPIFFLPVPATWCKESIPIGNHNPLVQWLQERWDSMKELALSEVQFDGLTIALVYSRFRALLDKRMN